MGWKMWRAWFLTTPFFRLLGNVVGDRAMCRRLPIHSGGGDIPNCADRPAMMKLKK